MKRGDLGELVKTLAGKSVQTLSPESNSFTLFDYSSLFEPAPGSHNGPLFSETLGEGAYQSVAHFYEALVGSIFGYTHQRSRISLAEGLNGYPDWLNPRRKQALECKSLVQGRTLDLRDHQMDYLREFQRTHPDYRTAFAVARYYRPEIPFPDAKASELIEMLCKNTAYLLVFPFSIAEALHAQSRGQKGIGYRWEGGKPWMQWMPRSRVNSTTVDALAFDPQEEISKLGLSPENYRFHLYRSSPHMRVHSDRISSFPIIKISDASHRKWIKSFLAQYTQEADEDGYEALERQAVRGEANLPAPASADDTIPF